MDVLLRAVAPFAVTITLCACVHTASSADGDADASFALTTGDGLSVALSDGGDVADIALDGRRVELTDAISGLWIRPHGGDFTPVAGTLAAQDGGVRQSRHYEGLGLRVQATYRSLPDVIACEGHIEDLTGQDRGVEVGFSLPVGGEGWRWGKSIREEVPVGAEPLEQSHTTFCSVSDPATGDGLALAVPADSPCFCWFRHDAERGFALRFRFGLSPAAGGELKSRAPFRFVIYRCDGRWGLRDAAQRYYALYPWAFESRAEREGLWIVRRGRTDEIPDPESYAFHEAVQSLDEAQWDDRHGIATCPYILPGQREITDLPELPESKREAWEVFQAWEPPDEIHTTMELRRLPGARVKQIIESCMLHDAEGLPQVRLRETPWGGNCVTFPMNTNPRLFEDTDRPTIAKELLDQVDEMHRRQPSLDGTYVDSLASWGSYLNFRRGHFGYAQVPLTFDPDTGRPAIHNRFALLEFLWALRERMHEQGKLVFGNGLRPARRFHCFATDVLGVEGHRFLEQKRVMAYRKPFLLLIYGVSDDPAQMEAHYDLCTLYGIYPWMSCFRQVAELNRRFVPILRTINAAGWEPVTGAESNDRAIWLERWGPDGQGRVYLTAYNSTRQLRPVRLRVEAGRLGLAGERLVAEDILRGWEGEAAMADGVADLDVPALPQRVRVLRLSGE